MINVRISHLQSAMGAQRVGELGVMFNSRCLRDTQVELFNWQLDLWAKGWSRHLIGDIGIEMCMGSNEKHEFEESHGETSDKRCKTLGSTDT